MEDINIYISIGGAAVALFSLVFTIVKYSKHEKRLNEQQELINSYQLKKIQEEESASHRAEIRGSIMPYTKGSVQLKVYNSGQANATNIKVAILGSDYGLLYEDFENIELLNPQKEYRYEISLVTGHVNTVKIKYTWDDESGKNNEYIDHLYIR